MKFASAESRKEGTAACQHRKRLVAPSPHRMRSLAAPQEIEEAEGSGVVWGCGNAGRWRRGAQIGSPGGPEKRAPMPIPRIGIQRKRLCGERPIMIE